MSTYEQKKEPVDPRYQFLLMAAEPYETIAFKIPSLKIDYGQGKMREEWISDTRKYQLQLYFELKDQNE
jgi:splicing factor 3A subunit 2